MTLKELISGLSSDCKAKDINFSPPPPPPDAKLLLSHPWAGLMSSKTWALLCSAQLAHTGSSLFTALW